MEDLKRRHGPLPPQIIQTMVQAAQNVASLCDEIELSVSAETARQALPRCQTASELRSVFVQITNTIAIELNDRRFYAPDGKASKYYDRPKLFGDDVFAKFPSANDDIYEAGMCLALERSTACVMHLNRALEVCLKALASAVSVGPQNDWGAYLREINKELEARVKRSGARTSDEQFYAETAANFDHLRRAYRNPTMHPDKSYSLERAEEILLATKSFMAHLASRISE